MAQTGGNLQQCIARNGIELRDFEMHLVMEYANENLTFWMACERFLVEPSFEFASDILEGYIVRNCENPINVSKEILTRLTSDLISMPPRTTGVEKAMKHVYEILLGSYDRFSRKNMMRNGQRKRRSIVTSLISTSLGSCAGKGLTRQSWPGDA